MVRIYALCATNGKALALPLMTLHDAESARESLAKLGKVVYVKNIKAI